MRLSSSLLLLSFTLVLDGPRVNECGSGGCAVGMGAVRLQRLGK